MYPDICLSPGSSRVDTTKVEIDQAEDGTIRGRSFFSKRTYTFALVHEALNRVDYDTLMAFVTSNYGNTFDFLWKADGITYVCAFSTMPTVNPLVGDYFTVNLGLTGSEK